MPYDFDGATGEDFANLRLTLRGVPEETMRQAGMVAISAMMPLLGLTARDGIVNTFEQSPGVWVVTYYCENSPDPEFFKRNAEFWKRPV